MTLIGPLVSTWQIEQAYIATLTVWLDEYLDEVERINGLTVGTSIPRPPSAAIYGGMDFTAYNQTLCPAVITVVKPVGAPERSADGVFQTYEVHVGAVVIDEDEDTSRMFASFYGAAIMGAIGHRGGLGGTLSASTVLTGAPDISLPEPDKRRTHLCVTTFQTVVSPILDPYAGPTSPTPQTSPEYGGTPDAPWNNEPTVTTTGLAVIAEPITS